MMLIMDATVAAIKKQLAFVDTAKLLLAMQNQPINMKPLRVEQSYVMITRTSAFLLRGN